MSTPTSKIAAGLAERGKASSTTPLSNLFGAPASLSQLQEAANNLATNRTKLKNMADDTRKAIETSRAEIEERYKDFGIVRDGRLVTRTVPENSVKAMMEREASKAARAARKVTGEDRAKLLAEVRELKSKVDSVRDAWSHPVTILDRRTRNNPDRATFSANLSGANVAAITHALRDAITTGSAPLAMAALMATERLSKESRKLIPFSARDVAEAIPDVREEYTKANRFITLSTLVAEESELAQAQAEGARDTARLLMRIGMLRNELEAYGPESETPSPAPESTPTPKPEPKVTGLTTDQRWERMLSESRIET